VILVRASPPKGAVQVPALELRIEEEFPAACLSLLLEALYIFEGGAAAVLHVQQRHFVFCLYPSVLM